MIKKASNKNKTDISSKKQNIVFFLPGYGDPPIGGYKIVYEYANRLSENGFDVHIMYPHLKYIPELKPFADKKNKILIIKLLKYIKFTAKKLLGKVKAAEWFDLNPSVKKDFYFEINSRTVKKYDKDSIFIATAIQTAYILAKCNLPRSRAFYFIQDFEAWFGLSEEQVLNSYRFNLNKIAIAPWLCEKVASVGETATLIPNGFDFEYFKLSNPIENRKSSNVLMLYHLDDRKRCVDSLAALEKVKKVIPDLHVDMFGTPEKPENLPEYIDYYQRPDRELHNKLYNDAAIFVAASKAEGMALPPAEAMICGAALCCTNIGGFALYAKNNETALTSPVYDIDKLAENIITLIQNDELRIKIAKAGNEFIKQFTWEKAVQSFIDYIKQCS